MLYTPQHTHTHTLTHPKRISQIHLHTVLHDNSNASKAQRNLCATFNSQSSKVNVTVYLTQTHTPSLSLSHIHSSTVKFRDNVYDTPCDMPMRHTQKKKIARDRRERERERETERDRR